MLPCWATSASSSSGPTAASASVSTRSTLSPVPLGTPNPAPPVLCSCLSSGGTLLHYAAANGHHDCVAWLLKRGCKVTPDSGALYIIISFLAQNSARDRMGCSAPTSQLSFLAMRIPFLTSLFSSPCRRRRGAGAHPPHSAPPNLAVQLLKHERAGTSLP